MIIHFSKKYLDEMKDSIILSYLGILNKIRYLYQPLVFRAYIYRRYHNISRDNNKSICFTRDIQKYR